MSVQVRTLDDLLHAPLDADSELTTQEYLVNMGPQHPIAHGSLRVVLRLDGETVKHVIPVPGYVHRGVEKMCEHLTYRQIIPYTDRLDYLSAIMNNWAVAKTVEKAANIPTNERIDTIRTIMSELQRLQSHALWWGVTGMDLGAYTAFLYGFREREIIGEIFEETIGARLTMNYIQPGGLMYDIKPDFAQKVKNLLPYLKGCIEQYETLLSGNVIFQERLRNIGILDGKHAIALGCTGPVLRASGVPYDLRAVEPYGVYDKVNFNVVVGEVGDCWDRYYVRLEEMRESVRIVEQLIDNIPEGPHATIRYNEEIILPEGLHYGQVETARGVFGVFIASDGKNKCPIRLHFRSPNFNNLWIVTAIASGWRIADFISIQSSLDLVIPDIDR
ncbi:MAG: NADH-quinone oxidoreductase subunit D [Candidatus Hydrogenedentes bacterium]|nr:NADH-quinone oxidoreductase subunit D [Candidatus Hydrogenedentota bacterium]